MDVAILFGVMFLPGIIGQGQVTDPAAFERIIYHAQILAVGLPQIALVLYIARQVDPELPSAIGARRPTVSDLALAAGAAIGIIVLSAAVVGATANGTTQGVTWRFNRPELAPLVLISSLTVGYREEIFFRAYLLTRLQTRGAPTAAAIAASALLFSVGHVYQGIAAAVFAALMGALLAIVWFRTRSLHGIAIAHGLYNAAVLLFAAGTG